DRLRVHEIKWLQVGSSTVTLNLYKAGELDWVGQNMALPAPYMRDLERFRDFSRSIWISTYWYLFNTRVPPLDNPLVRRALNLAIDKALLVEKVARGGQIPATHYVPDFVGGGYAAQVEAERASDAGDRFVGAGHDFDAARARALLVEAGYEVKKDEAGGWSCPAFPAVDILYNTLESHRKLAVYIQSMWKRHLGISVQLRNEEWKVMLKNLRDGKFTIARFGWTGDYNHPLSWLETFRSESPNNLGGYGDAEYDRLLDRASRTPDAAAAMRLFRDAEARLVEAMPRLPLYFYTKSTLVKPYVKGFYPNVMNRHAIRWMWIDPAWRDDRDNRPAVAPRALGAPGVF
ncbi:MAG: peptide ABC transporter substrate-binding protein, partial [Myxococcota bacterium]